MTRMLQLSTVAIICVISVLVPGCSTSTNTKSAEQPNKGTAVNRGNLQRTGVYQAVGVRQFHEVAWTFGEPPGGLCWPVIAYKDEVYLGCDGAFHSLDLQTGKEKWELENVPISSPPILTNELLYFGSTTMHPSDQDPPKWNIRLAVVDIVARTVKKEFPVGGFEVETSPVFIDGMIYFLTTDGTLHAVDATTSNERWQLKTGGTARPSSEPAVANGIIYFVTYDEDYVSGDVGSSNGFLYAVNIETGKELWKFPTNLGNSPVVADRLLFIQTGVFLVALDAMTGGEKWRIEGVTGPPAVAEGVVYIGGQESGGTADPIETVPQHGYLQAISAQTGQQIWKIDVDGSVAIKTSPSIADGVIYFWSGTGKMEAIDLASKQWLWSYKPPDLTTDMVILIDFGPVIADGMVFFNSFDRVYAVR